MIYVWVFYTWEHVSFWRMCVHRELANNVFPRHLYCASFCEPERLHLPADKRVSTYPKSPPMRF